MTSLGDLLANHGDLAAFAQSPPAHLESAPKEVRDRVKALKQLQLETVDIQADFYKRVHELENEFRSRYDKVNEKRQKIVSGEYEPGENETQQPLFHYLDEEESKKFDDNAPISGSEKLVGVPNFWLNVLKAAPTVGEIITEDDEAILKYLADIKVTNTLEPPGFTLYFEFAENPFFKNKVLTKEYKLSLGPNGFEPTILYDGPSVVATKGCTIEWNDGKNATQKVVKKKQKKGANAGRYVTKTVENESFFQFFKPAVVEISKDLTDEQGELLNSDFEAGQMLRESVIDSAVLYYTGELADDDDDGIYEDSDFGEDNEDEE